MKFKLTFILIFLVSLLYSQTPNQWNWGEGQLSTEAKGNWINLERLVKQKDYNSATVPLVWLLNNTPNLNAALYIKATKVYKSRAIKEKNPQIRQSLQDSTLMLYDKRIELFGDEENVLNRKGKVAWKFLYKRPNTIDNLFILYKKIYTLNQNKTYSDNMMNYMSAAIVQYKKNKINKQELIDIYSSCVNVIGYQFSKSRSISKSQRIEKHMSFINKIFVKNINLSCQELDDIIAPNILSGEWVMNSKSYVNLCILSKCYNDVFLQEAEKLIEVDSNFVLCKTVGILHLNRGDMINASKYLNKSIELENDTTKHAKIYFKLAQVKANENDKPSAREYALKSLNINPELIEIYNFIGDLYFESANECVNDDVLKKRAIYIAAYDMYKKGNNMKSMGEAKEQFPSMEELFLRNKKINDVINTGCWLNETVALQIRN